MITEISSVINTLGSSNVVIGLLGVALILLISSLRSHQKIRTINKQLQRLQHDLRVSNSSAIGMGQELISLEKQLNQKAIAKVAPAHAVQPAVLAEEKPFSTEFANEINSKAAAINYKTENSVYDQARQSLAQGQSVADVAKQCGISHAEVSLLEALSRKAISSH